MRRDGDHFVVDGRPWAFVGLNVYNANSRSTCWYPMGDGELTAAFQRSGATAMRAWFFQPLITTSASEWDWAPFDETLATARRNGVRVIVTLGNQWGDCDRGAPADVEWYRDGYRTETTSPNGRAMPTTYRDYVAAVVARYRDDPTVLAWQLINEPVPFAIDGKSCAVDASAVLVDFTVDVSSMIRSIDPHHLVTQGTIGSGQCGTAGHEYERLVRAAQLDWCEYHDYDDPSAFPGDEWNGLGVRVAQCAGLPVVIGEQGLRVERVGTAAQRAALVAAKLDSARSHGIDGYLAWGYADPPAGFGGADPFAVVPGDPLLSVLSAAAGAWSH